LLEALLGCGHGLSVLEVSWSNNNWTYWDGSA
jgi:hypothetical protein